MGRKRILMLRRGRGGEGGGLRRRALRLGGWMFKKPQ
jgi:hypothetical protein